MRKFKKIFHLSAAFLLLVFATKEFLGYHYYYRYRALRKTASSIEGSFPDLEKTLKKALKFSKNPLVFKALARIHLEMALGENEFGSPEQRDVHLDFSQEYLLKLIGRNPIDPFAYYEMGKVYMLYNYPLCTYLNKATVFFEKSLELKPADEFLNSNISFMYLTKWDMLSIEDQKFILKTIGQFWEKSESFILQLSARWEKNREDPDRLKDIFMSDRDLWLKIRKYFVE